MLFGYWGLLRHLESPATTTRSYRFELPPAIFPRDRARASHECPIVAELMRLREAIGESVFMRTITSVCFGLALALSAFALTSAPTAALEAPAVAPTAKSGVTKVQEGYREERAERCEHVRRECHERHGDREEYRECVERHHCEPGERERAERCERVRDECRERHPDREEFRECLVKHDCG